VLQITKNWPKGTSIKVVFDVNQEGILAVHASVGEEALDFSLTIKGVKSEEELSNSKMTIGKTVVS
jgi:hypothetical protein